MQKLNYQNVHHHILQTAIFDEWMRLQWAKLVQNYAIQIKNNVYKKILNITAFWFGFEFLKQPDLYLRALSSAYQFPLLAIYSE